MKGKYKFVGKEFIVIRFSTGDEADYFVASGALGFSGQGWFWERLLVWLGLIRPELFAVVLKSLTRYPRKGNLHWWKPWTWLPFSPWSCVRFLPGGAVNKVGLTNPGIEWWCKKIGPKLNFHKFKIIASIFGTLEELVEMTQMLNQFKFFAIEVNVSCPNADHETQTKAVIDSVIAVKKVSHCPIIVKVACDQDYLVIAKSLVGFAEAISLNSVLWKIVFPEEISPLSYLEKKIGGGGGGVSGEPAQKFNWMAVEALAIQKALPVIAPCIMEYEDLACVRSLGASAVSFGTIHMKTPCKATKIVLKDIDRKWRKVAESQKKAYF